MASRFRKWICERQVLWVVLLALTLVNLVLGLLSAPTVDEGSASYYVLMFDFGLIAIMLAILGLVFWRCGYLADEPMY